MSEPVCGTVGDLSQDQAWLVLRTACRSDQSDACEQFRTTQAGVLEFDARERRWQAFWEQQRLTLKFDVAGVPTLRLRPADARPLEIVVTNISPLVYSATPGTPKEEDLAVIANLKTLLASVGTGLQAAVQAAAARTSPASLAEELSASRQEMAPDASGTRQAACTIGPPDAGATGQAIVDRALQAAPVASEVKKLETELDRLQKNRATFLGVLQKAEDALPVTLGELLSSDVKALDDRFVELDSAVATFQTKTAQLVSCHPLFEAYSALLQAPPNLTVLRALATAVGPTASAFKVCQLQALRTSIAANAEELFKPCSAAELKEMVDLHSKAMRPLVMQLLEVKKSEESLWQTIDKAKESKENVLASATTLARQVDRGRKSTWNGTLIRELVVTRQNPELRWSQVQTHTVVIKADTPYAKSIALAHPTEWKHDYKLESATGRILGYGIGVVYTPLQESTWSAVTVPGTSTKVITETKKETRAGDVAAFLNYRFLEHSTRVTGPVRPTVDFGVGLTSDRPAFFLGGGLEILRAARLGFGWTAQRVSELASDQTPGLEVASDGDIRTVRRFNTANWYVSLSFAIDSLSLFNGPK